MLAWQYRRTLLVDLPLFVWHKADRGIGQFRIRHILDLADDSILRANGLRFQFVCPDPVNWANIQHAHHAGHDTVRPAPGVYFIDAHVAFLDQAVRGIILRCSVGACRFATSAANAQRRIDVDDTVFLAFIDSTGRPSRQAGRLCTVVTRIKGSKS